ncbi:MAG: endonuclease/exonuclease/phosphatase family protein [Deltaproteobacteria bacterium]|jgi:endonuclease/exonuclease/phosphatase family metal-dependent hydrolase
MRVMTFNLRFANPADGPNEWQFRKELVAEVILTHLPDLLGTQEGTVPQLQYLTENLPGYAPLTAHRRVDPTCQYPTIFYRADRFQVHESNEFWLSETPTVHRSRSWDSAFPRMVTYGLFQETGRDLSFYFINTHLDHISEMARREGARMMGNFFFARNRPIILVGDFNEPPEDTVYQELVGGDSPLKDTWREVYPPGQEATTQHGFDGELYGHRIDWILATPPFRVRGAAIVTDSRNGRYPSDHFPYEAEVEY